MRIKLTKEKARSSTVGRAAPPAAAYYRADPINLTGMAANGLGRTQDEAIGNLVRAIVAERPATDWGMIVIDHWTEDDSDDQGTSDQVANERDQAAAEAFLETREFAGSIKDGEGNRVFVCTADDVKAAFLCGLETGRGEPGSLDECSTKDREYAQRCSACNHWLKCGTCSSVGGNAKNWTPVAVRQAEEPANARPCGECAKLEPDGDSDPAKYGKCAGRHFCTHSVESDCKKFTPIPAINPHLVDPLVEPVPVEDITPGWYFWQVHRGVNYLHMNGEEVQRVQSNKEFAGRNWYHAPDPNQLMAMCGGESQEDLHADLTEVYARCKDLEARNVELLGQLTLLRNRISTSVTKLRTIKEAEETPIGKVDAKATCGTCSRWDWVSVNGGMCSYDEIGLVGPGTPACERHEPKNGRRQSPILTDKQQSAIWNLIEWIGSDAKAGVVSIDGDRPVDLCKTLLSLVEAEETREGGPALTEQESLALCGARDLCGDIATEGDPLKRRWPALLHTWAHRIQGIIDKSKVAAEPPEDNNAAVLTKEQREALRGLLTLVRAERACRQQCTLGSLDEWGDILESTLAAHATPPE